MACVAEREAAVREVAEVYELIKLQQPLFFLHSNSQQQPPPSTTTQLAHSLLGKALRALNVALSVMNQPPVTPVSVVVKAEPHQLSPPTSPASADSHATAPTRGAKRRRSSTAMDERKKKTSSPCTTLTTAVPYDDGYEWRKYGEKKINGTLFTRSYFRCTYKDDAGCLATKYVQQVDNNGGSPMFHVTYNNHHTCSSAKDDNTGSGSKLAALLLAGCCNMIQEPICQQHAAAAAAMDMKQEPPQLLPSLVDHQPPACSAHEQIPRCQEPRFHVAMEQQFCGAVRDDHGEIPSATGSRISGETSCWHEYRYSEDMAAAEDDPLHDLERFLFMDY